MTDRRRLGRQLRKYQLSSQSSQLCSKVGKKRRLGKKSKLGKMMLDKKSRVGKMRLLG
jgi:hypothetical protein